MTRISSAEELPIWQLAGTWVLMLPLFYYASMGVLWFQSAAVNNELSYTYGSLASFSGTDAGSMVTAVVFLLVAILLFPWMRHLIRDAQRDRFFTALVALAALSALWSQFPAKSLQWSAVAGLCVLFAFYLHRRFPPERLIGILLLLGSICLTLSIVLAMFFPFYGTDHTQVVSSWRGIYSVKNTCADMTAFLLLPSFYFKVQSDLWKLLRAFYIAASVVLIWMTKSSTGLILVGTIVGCVCTLRLLARFQATAKALLLALAVVLAIVLIAVSVAYTPELTSLLGKDPTLTGRTGIWEASLISIMKRPILGYGYMAFWRGYSGESSNISLANHWSVTHAHNGFLEVWLSLGLVGLLLILLTFLRAFRDAILCIMRGGPGYLQWYMSTVVLTVVYNLGESAMVATNHLAWILYIVACLGLAEGARCIRLGHADV